MMSLQFQNGGRPPSWILENSHNFAQYSGIWLKLCTCVQNYIL